MFKVFSQIKKSRLGTNIAFFTYNEILPRLKGHKVVSYKQKDVTDYNESRIAPKKLSELRLAIICDEMTYQNFKNECEICYITPYDWLAKLKRFKPDALLCESAWSGITETNAIWRGKIYRNRKLIFENRKELLSILNYCNEVGIKTIFWNKEDPVYFGSENHDFVDTALKFDYIFTTEKECVEKYNDLGHQNVYQLMFGFSPKLFNPLNREKHSKSAVFAGSYYSDLDNRKKNLEKLFDCVLAQDFDMVIYDRYYNSKYKQNKFPDKYQKYVRAPVKYQDLCSEYKKYSLAININTVTDSETMFARRVYELMASGLPIISNRSRALISQFKNSIYFLEDTIDFTKLDSAVAKNVELVFRQFRNEVVLLKALNHAGFTLEAHLSVIYLIFMARQDVNEAVYQRIQYDNKRLIYLDIDKSLVDYTTNETVDVDDLTQGAFVFLDGNENVDVDYLRLHLEYLDAEIGVKGFDHSFRCIEDGNNYNVLFPVCEIKKLVDNINCTTCKYLV